MKQSMFWCPPVELSSQEQKIAKRAAKKRKLFVFLREIRHQLFDESFQEELLEMYRNTGAGTPPIPPALMAMATLLQKYTRVSDNETVELTVDSKRWQMVLDCLGEEHPPFSQSVFYDFRQRLIASNMDQRLLERTVELAREIGGFSSRSLKAAFDSSPFEGAGRVEDTLNLLAHAARKTLDCISKLTKHTIVEITEEIGLQLFSQPSIKAAFDIQWNDSEQKSDALTRLCDELLSLEQWTVKHLSPYLKTKDTKKAVPSPLSNSLSLLKSIMEQDLEKEEDSGTFSIKKGVTRDRIISISDPQMRHGRKSQKHVFNGYKRHIARDLEEKLILSAIVTPGNEYDAEATPYLIEDCQKQGRIFKQVSVDRAYLSAPALKELRLSGAEIQCRAPAEMRREGMFSKQDFEIDLQKMIAKCPAGEEKKIKLGKFLTFPGKKCSTCSMRSQCTTLKKGGRRLKIHEDEAFYQELREREKTTEGRAKLRDRVKVEHGLAHVSQRQGNKARYRGTRKNTFELRIVCAIQNLERASIYQSMAFENAA